MDVNRFQNTRRGAFVAALVALCLPSCTPNPNGMGVADFGSVIGRVVDRVSGRPIPGALVSIGELASNTDSTGQFAISNVPVGTQTLHISAVGWQATSVTVTVLKNQQTPTDLIGLVSSLGS